MQQYDYVHEIKIYQINRLTRECFCINSFQYNIPTINMQQPYYQQWMTQNYNNQANQMMSFTQPITIEKQVNENVKIEMFNISKDKHHEIMGINTKQQLIELEKLIIN